jgi:AbrB family looped-hinge helix DNA binding protein
MYLKPKDLKIRKSYFLTRKNIMELTKISSRGQIVIPQSIRNDMAISEGAVIAIERINDMIVLKKIDVDLVSQFKKSLEDVRAGRIKRVA